MKHSKIAIVIGTKAELIKCLPVMLELQNRKLDYWFISTGQHPMKEAAKEFEVKQPDFILSEEPKLTTKFWSRINSSSIFWCFSMLSKIRRVVKKINPKHVIYHGDTMSTAVASMSTSRVLNPFGKKWNNVHLEAGLRSGSLLEPFPEEISRRISTIFSDTLFSVSDLTYNNLKKYKRKKLLKVGNTIIDSSLHMYGKGKLKNKKEKEEYALINLHRHEHLIDKEKMKKLVDTVRHVKIKGIWPLHDNTKKDLQEYGLYDEIKKMKNIKITPLRSYEDFIFLLANCKYLITDGGSIQEESLVFKKPCLILRNKTERQEGLSSGINFLTKLDLEYAKEIIEKIERNKIKVKNFKNPYGEPGVSKKIVDELLK